MVYIALSPRASVQYTPYNPSCLCYNYYLGFSPTCKLSHYYNESRVVVPGCVKAIIHEATRIKYQ